MALDIVVVGAAALAFPIVWVFRRKQLQHIRAQRHYVTVFAKQARMLRQRADIPASLHSIIEEMVQAPFDGRFVRYAIRRGLRRNEPPACAEARRRMANFRADLRRLDKDTLEHLNTLVVSFALAQSHSTIFAGYVFRRLVMGGLSRDTQAEVALESVVREHAAVAA